MHVTDNHVVSNVSIDTVSNVTIATIQSYVSVDKRVVGKLPVQAGTAIAVNGMPAPAYVERRLIEPRPVHDVERPATMPYGPVDRYLLSKRSPWWIKE
ncbi:hypothetical protein [Burkholderia sp. BCC0322]|uniref:hypothetical protein n=1 Tax=Burkholderia sp. BCC0322 TaxID=2676296 RepID=UPI00158A2619|nr:hypothetical protein [Burkholderia sp. BCC0322]